MFKKIAEFFTGKKTEEPKVECPYKAEPIPIGTEASIIASSPDLPAVGAVVVVPEAVVPTSVVEQAPAKKAPAKRGPAKPKAPTAPAVKKPRAPKAK